MKIPQGPSGKDHGGMNSHPRRKLHRYFFFYNRNRCLTAILLSFPVSNTEYNNFCFHWCFPSHRDNFLFIYIQGIPNPELPLMLVLSALRIFGYLLQPVHRQHSLRWNIPEGLFPHPVSPSYFPQRQL